MAARLAASAAAAAFARFPVAAWVAAPAAAAAAAGSAGPLVIRRSAEARIGNLLLPARSVAHRSRML